MVLTTDTKERALACARLGMGKISTETALGLKPGTLRAEFKRDGAFAEAWSEAVEDSTEAVEEAVRERALNGDMTAATALLKAKGAKEWKPDRTGPNSDTPNMLVLATVEQLAALGARLEERRQTAIEVRSVPVIDPKNGP